MQTATLREFREDFPSIRRRVDRYGEVVVMRRGKPFYVITRLVHRETKTPQVPIPDYWAILQKRQSKPLTPEQTQSLHEENRGDH